MSEQGTNAHGQDHKQKGWREPPQSKSTTPAPVTEEMLDIVLACYFSNPVAFAAHAHDLPVERNDHQNRHQQNRDDHQARNQLRR